MNQIKELIPELYQDISDLASTGRMQRAIQLSKEFTSLLGTPFFFSHCKIPHYPVRNLDAKTVFVHLNPGVSLGNARTAEEFYAQQWDKKQFYQEYNLPENATAEQLFEKYLYFWEWYARKRFGGERKKIDNFDFKSACFLQDWPDSGIELKKGNFKDPELQIHNTINVIDQKLQLELFPYGSNTISTHLLDDVFRKKPQLITPFIEKQLDIIALYPRKYVIFGSNVYVTLFKLYDDRISKIIDFISPKQRFEGITKNSLSFTFIRISWKGKKINAGIAHSFPRRDLPNAYEKMSVYGRKCYETYMKYSNYE